MRQPAEQGFTLIEMLVALAVFSLAVLALLNLVGENTRSASAVQTRLLAAVVAENQAVEALIAAAPPPIGTAEGEASAAGIPWRWRREVRRTSDPDILRIDVRVSTPGAMATAAEVTVFRGPST